jgi:hypothetical protein
MTDGLSELPIPAELLTPEQVRILQVFLDDGFRFRAAEPTLEAPAERFTVSLPLPPT